MSKMPRAGEAFRVRPGEDNRKHMTVLEDAPEKGVVTEHGYSSRPSR
jgi:hypothetical protein